MVVQHNLRAMNSNRMLGLTANVQAKSTEKLSSGYKINRAADDAAGLSISEKMRKQIRGLSQASLNAQDGISAVQTAEGALNEVQDMLQRMNELAVKAANGTMSESDRSYIQNEIDQLTTEIDRVAETTKFNETYLLKGVEGTETVETAASIEVAYDKGITGEKTLEWKAGGPALFATKEGKSVAVTEQNYKDFFSADVKTEVDKVTIAKDSQLYNDQGDRISADAAKDILNAGGKVFNNTGTRAVLNDSFELTQKKAVEGVDYNFTAAKGATVTLDLSGVNAAATTREIAGKDVKTLTTAQDIYDALNGDTTVTNKYDLTFDATSKKLTLTTKVADQYTTTAGDVAAAAFTGDIVDGTTLASKSETTAGNIASVELKNASALYEEDEADENTTLADSDAYVAALKADGDLYTSATYYDAKDGRTVYDIDGNVMDADAITTEFKRQQANPTTTLQMFTTSPTEAEEGTDYTSETVTKDIISVKDGYEIYSANANENNQFGAQKVDTKVTNFDNNFSIESDLLYAKDASDPTKYNTVSAEELKNFFDEDGTYKGGLFKKNAAGTQTEVGAEQIDDYVDWNKTDASTEEVAVRNVLTLSLQVGADSTVENKISVDIESMGAENLGVAGLKVDGKDSTNADAAVETIAAAIEKVSAQRSALGAVQNRLEHTIANLDNVVENTTAAESQIRDTDMATEMVKFSNNNILAQAGQAMLAQANQANQGVLSLLG